MRVGLLHLGQSVDFVVSITFLRSPVFAIFAMGRVFLLREVSLLARALESARGFDGAVSNSSECQEDARLAHSSLPDVASYCGELLPEAGCVAGCVFDASGGGDTLVGFCAPPEGAAFGVDAAGAVAGATVGDVTVVWSGCALGSSSGSCLGN